MERDRTHLGVGDLVFAPGAAETDRNQSRDEREATRRELLRRNRELAAAAAVAEATSTDQLDLHGTLEQALNVVLEVTGLPAGWILLLPEGGGEPALASSAGLPQEIAGQQAMYRPPDCECIKALESRRPLVVHPLHPRCPIRALELPNGGSPSCHATVPLLTRSKVLGVLNVASEEPVVFDEQELTLLSAIGRQLGIAIENARLWEALRRRELLRGQLLEQAMAAQEEERKRIARELHDRIGQALTSVLLGLRALETAACDDGALVVDPARLGDLKAIVAGTLDSVRDLALGLRPSVLDDLGLTPALRRSVRTFKARHGLAVDFQCVGLEKVRLSPPVETALYRIVQEALTNIAQHARAERVSLLLEARTDAVVLIVEDDGQGFDAHRLMRRPADEHWLGLYGMRERAELLGGKLTIESSSGSGTTVFVEVPVQRDLGEHSDRRGTS